MTYVEFVAAVNSAEQQAEWQGFVSRASTQRDDFFRSYEMFGRITGISSTKCHAHATTFSSSSLRNYEGMIVAELGRRRIDLLTSTMSMSDTEELINAGWPEVSALFEAIIRSNIANIMNVLHVLSCAIVVVGDAIRCPDFGLFTLLAEQEKVAAAAGFSVQIFDRTTSNNVLKMKERIRGYSVQIR